MSGTVLPLLTALLAAALAARIGGSCVRRPSPSKVFWAMGLVCASAASAAEAYAAAGGWSPVTFRIYYLAGGCLTVAFLGTGSAWLKAHRDAALLVTGGLVTAAVAATVSVLTATVHPGVLAAARGGRPPADSALAGHVFLWAIGLNSIGTVLIVAASLTSIAHRRRLRANLLILGGIGAFAASGALTRIGSYDLVYASQAVGLVLLAAGCLLAEQRVGSAPRLRGLGVRAAEPSR